MFKGKYAFYLGYFTDFIFYVPFRYIVGEVVLSNFQQKLVGNGIGLYRR